MCNGFGAIVDKAGGLYFTAPDRGGDVSHSDILAALGRKDNDNQFVRAFVRVECKDWTIGSFCFDETDSLPGWVDEQAVKDRVEALLDRAYPAWVEYHKARAAARAEYHKAEAPARAEYDKATAAARAEYAKVEGAAGAEYRKARAAAEAEYHKVCGAAWAEYGKTEAVAWVEYAKVEGAARAEYAKGEGAARAEYDRAVAAARAERDKAIAPAWATLATALSGIPGYVEGKAG